MLIGFVFCLFVTAQPNYDEIKVPEFTLPDPLMMANGKMAKTTKDWEKQRKIIFSHFEKEMYGVNPQWDGEMKVSMISSPETVFEGMAKRKQVLITLTRNGKQMNIPLLMYIPVSEKPVPVFLGYNFSGNHTIHTDPGIFIFSGIHKEGESEILENRKAEFTSGSDSASWPLLEILSRGYALATMYYEDVDPDFDDDFKNGIHGLYDLPLDSAAWGSIAAWSWGLSRAVDYMETDMAIDSKKMIAIGHSRLGKAALWAGASDIRIAMVISNNSGCGGAALSRRKFGETVATINTSFPHWFCNNFNKYNHKEETLPIDQHQLIALMAPRPIYIASATEDLWADPRGEFLAGVHAGNVYQLFGRQGLNTHEMPLPDTPVGDFIGYHLRTGPHDITKYDWIQFMQFADKHFGR